MRAWAGVVVLGAGICCTSGAAAQLPQPGARSLQVGVGGSGSIGVWRMHSPRTNLGLNVGLSVDRSGPREAKETGESVSLEPAFKRYASPLGRVSPFLFGGVLASYAHQRGPGWSWNGLGAGVEGAVGVDWFPVHDVSLGGYLGAAAAYSSGRSRPDNGPAAPRITFWEVRSLASGLTLHLYF